ncbi:DUF6728 family protein [Xanthovirga aplysinae]|uniref:DUF6728 family protein n=1 Tax=Xanthovirga aplysinae TaxID=2529853 RepID=UPI0012BBD4B5|nr:DUF6728 family protein [Xanthovirga aplysinae]MTI31151.1 hypothetical protein [Xanthovirga aplysinae]
MNKKRKSTMGEFFGLGELFGYFFRKKDSNRPKSLYLKMMHGINRFSIIVFLLALIYLILKRLI